jgi:predicted ABC-type exoprotein transport system permease subunit
LVQQKFATSFFPCSAKETAFHFSQISKLLKSQALRSNTGYYNHLSTGISVLLMFCEDQNSAVRNDAQEHLFRIVRFCESNGSIVHVQIDLYHEIKKNGNERSLRICLNLFGQFCHLIKQRKARKYAQNLLPCIVAVVKRRETMLLETLNEFLKSFAKHLQICMKDYEIIELLEVIIGQQELVNASFS